MVNDDLVSCTKLVSSFKRTLAEKELFVLIEEEK